MYYLIFFSYTSNGDNMKIDYKKLFLNILIPVILGAIVGFLSGSSKGYDYIVQPSFAPPSIVFPIVWTILYILMGVSSYIVSTNDAYNNALPSYYFQLIINLLWSFIFFKFKLYFIAFLWIILLIVSVIVMIKKFYNISRVSAYLQIPYLLWLIFAAYLNYAIYILN